MSESGVSPQIRIHWTNMPLLKKIHNNLPCHAHRAAWNKRCANLPYMTNWSLSKSDAYPQCDSHQYPMMDGSREDSLTMHTILITLWGRRPKEEQTWHHLWIWYVSKNCDSLYQHALVKQIHKSAWSCQPDSLKQETCKLQNLQQTDRQPTK